MSCDNLERYLFELFFCFTEMISSTGDSFPISSKTQNLFVVQYLFLLSCHNLFKENSFLLDFSESYEDIYGRVVSETDIVTEGGISKAEFKCTNSPFLPPDSSGLNSRDISAF